MQVSTSCSTRANRAGPGRTSEGEIMQPISAGEELGLHGRVRRSCLIFAAGLTFAAHASAKTFPAGAVQLIVPFSPGSGSDFVARIFGAALTSALHQPAFVTHKTCAGRTNAAHSGAQA